MNTPRNDHKSNGPPAKRESSSMGWRGPMRPGHMAMLRAEKARDFRGTIGKLQDKLIKYLGAYNKLIVIVMIVAIASTIFTIVGPKLLGQATTKLFEGVMGQISGTGQGGRNSTPRPAGRVRGRLQDHLLV